MAPSQRGDLACLIGAHENGLLPSRVDRKSAGGVEISRQELDRVDRGPIRSHIGGNQLVAVIGNVLVGLVAVSLFTATIRLSK